MTFDPDDPRLTAFVLGELEPSDRPEVERLIESSPEARQAADEIRRTIGWLTDQLRDEQSAHAEAPRPHSETAPPATTARRWRRPTWIGLAASILIVGVTIGLLLPARYAARESAQPDRYFRATHAPGVSAAAAPTPNEPMLAFRSAPRAPGGPPVPRSAAVLAGSGAPMGPTARPGRSRESIMPADGSGGMANMMAGMMGGMAGRGRQGSNRRDAAVPGRSAQTGPPRNMPGFNGGQPGADVASNAMYNPGAKTDFSLPAPATTGQAPTTGQGRGIALGISEEPPALSRFAGPTPDVNQQVAPAPAVLEPQQPGGEVFLPIVDNPFIDTKDDRQSTFSIDVDTAGYANVRRYLTAGALPPPDAVRIEELLNYFPYDDAPPPSDARDPFAVHVEIGGCPWGAGHRLARVGIQAREIDQSRRPPSNLVFLIDVSGSMDEELPMIQWGLSQLVEQLNENDRVAIVVYAGASGLVLPSKSCLHKAEILSTLESLRAGGSTNGGAGIQLAYQVAAANFIKNGTNRVIWATDGDLNVGITGRADLVNLIQAKAKSGVFLSVLGCGTGNIKDGPLEQIADKGNGHYAYIDSPREAYRVLVEQMGSTLVTVAKDVKIQVDFDPAAVAKFRLIGYENRVMDHQDFTDDTKDAGEIGAGHHVTALYELVPTTAPPAERRPMTVKLRYKKPSEDASRLLEFPATDSGTDFGHASDDLKFASAVAGFGMMLRDSPYRGTLTYGGVLEIAQPTLARDRSGYRKEFVELVRRAQALPGPAR